VRERVMRRVCPRRDPIDLSTIQKRLDQDYYITADIFKADLQRMIDNWCVPRAVLSR
jgi:hypothetical protein